MLPANVMNWLDFYFLLVQERGLAYLSTCHKGKGTTGVMTG